MPPISAHLAIQCPEPQAELDFLPIPSSFFARLAANSGWLITSRILWAGTMIDMPEIIFSVYCALCPSVDISASYRGRQPRQPRIQKLHSEAFPS